MNTMKSSMTRMIAVTLIGCLALTAMATAEDWYTMSGDDFAVTSGYAWDNGAGQWTWPGSGTNFNTKMRTSTSSTNIIENGYHDDYGLTYDNFEQFGTVVISGSFAANALSGLCASSYVQIGLMTEAMIDNSEHGYASWQFNDSVMISLVDGAINVTDYNLGGGRRSSTITYDGTKQLDYQMTVDFDTSTASLIVDNGGGWSSEVSTLFGISDWGAAGNSGSGNFDLTQPEDYSSAALFANIYNENSVSGTAATASFGNITVSVPNLSGSGTSQTITSTGSAEEHFWAGSDASKILEVVFNLDSGNSMTFTSNDITASASSALEAVMASEGVDGQVSQVWDFDTAGYTFGDGESVALSFDVGLDPSLDNINLWHDDGSGWSLVDLDAEGITATLINGELTFSGVDDFSSYGVSVPEPTTMSLLGLGGLALLQRRRSRQA